MNQALRHLPPPMTVEEFYAWPGDGTGRIYELVDGTLRAQDAASDTHGTVHTNITRAISNHLIANRPGCRLVTAPGVKPRIRAKWNHRIPELGVTCQPNRPDQHTMPDPIVIVEILSPSNQDDTWSNVALYASLPSVVEILIVDSTEVSVQILRRGADGSWPENPEPIAANGAVKLASIGFELAVAEMYRDTYLANRDEA
jgi:Uma2 family endonuclease